MKHSTKYILALFITSIIFVGAWYMSTMFNNKKFTNLKAAQEKIAIDILSSETEFDLLKQGICDDTATAVFSRELGSLAEKITYSEQNVATPQEINTLKKQYTLLEIRDFLLTKRVSERCHKAPINIFYFYGTKIDCPDCVRQEYVLNALRQFRPDIRVYVFDYNLDLSTIRALLNIYNIRDVLPALVINGTTYQGYQSIEQLSVLIPKQSVPIITNNKNIQKQ